MRSHVAVLHIEVSAGTALTSLVGCKPYAVMLAEVRNSHRATLNISQYGLTKSLNI